MLEFGSWTEREAHWLECGEDRPDAQTRWRIAGLSCFDGDKRGSAPGVIIDKHEGWLFRTAGPTEFPSLQGDLCSVTPAFSACNVTLFEQGHVSKFNKTTVGLHRFFEKKEAGRKTGLSGGRPCRRCILLLSSYSCGVIEKMEKLELKLEGVRVREIRDRGDSGFRSPKPRRNSI